MTTRTPIRRSSILLLAILMATVVGVLPVDAAPRPSSDLLLPFFEVDMGSPSGATTLVAVGSAADEAVEVRMEMTSNWGIPVVRSTFDLEPGEVATFNLRDWLVGGKLPDRQLNAGDKAHIQAALQGVQSPRDDLYYASETDPNRPELMVGAVTFRVVSQPRADALWGDFFWVRPGDDFASGDLLVNIDRSSECSDICQAHRLRYLEGGAFDGGTRLVIWSDRRGTASPTPNPVAAKALLSGAAFHDEPGVQFAERDMDLLPVTQLAIADLALDKAFGWLDLVTDEPVFVGVRYEAGGRYGVGIASWCLEDEEPPTSSPQPSIDLEKATNGEDADVAPGPFVDPGAVITWTYDVTNTGETGLSQISVTDDQGVVVTCPRTTLEAGEMMTCTGTGIASVIGQYRNLGTVTGRAPGGKTVSDSDPSHYWGEPTGDPKPASIDLEKATNGHDADVAPGPTLQMGEPVTWTYVVTNTGGVRLTQIVVTDDQGVSVTCPKASLAKGESMTCTGSGLAIQGQYANLGTVTGMGAGVQVSDSDPSHYYGEKIPPELEKSVSIEKYTNGHDADVAPGPTLQAGDTVNWTYVVTNTGEMVLENLEVTDDQGVTVTCPESSLEAGEQMTCTGTGVAVVGQYKNIGTVTCQSPMGDPLTDSDPSHYYGEQPPEQCGDCEGKVTRLTLRYDGLFTANLRVVAKRGPDSPVVFDQTVLPGATFEVVGPAGGSGGFAGTLGTEINIYVDGNHDAFLHTSCSAPVGPGTVAGSFTVVAGESRHGGPLCPAS
jgi:hypothetical protein